MAIGEKLGIGRTATVYAWGANEVVKLFHEAGPAWREAANAERVARLDIRTPAYGGIVEVEGRIGLIYERIRGRTLLQSIEPSGDSVKYHAELMADLHVQLHDLTVDSPSDCREELASRIRRTQALDGDVKARVLAVLDRLPDGQRVCHYDFHPDNILLTDAGPVVIDWMNVLIGCPDADVARTSMMLRTGELPPEAPQPELYRRMRAMFHDAYLDAYLRHGATDAQAIGQWKIPTLAYRLEELTENERVEILRLLSEGLATKMSTEEA